MLVVGWLFLDILSIICLWLNDIFKYIDCFFWIDYLEVEWFVFVYGLYFRVGFWDVFIFYKFFFGSFLCFL